MHLRQWLGMCQPTFHSKQDIYLNKKKFISLKEKKDPKTIQKDL